MKRKIIYRIITQPGCPETHLDVPGRQVSKCLFQTEEDFLMVFALAILVGPDRAVDNVGLYSAVPSQPQAFGILVATLLGLPGTVLEQNRAEHSPE